MKNTSYYGERGLNEQTKLVFPTEKHRHSGEAETASPVDGNRESGHAETASKKLFTS